MKLFWRMVGDIIAYWIYLLTFMGSIWVALDIHEKCTMNYDGIMNIFSVLFMGVGVTIIGHCMFWPLWREDDPNED